MWPASIAALGNICIKQFYQERINLSIDGSQLYVVSEQYYKWKFSTF